MSPQPVDTIKGFAVTFRQLFSKPITVQYPEYVRPVYPRFRGRHRLHRHENGLEKCVGCSLCAAACPADCIRVVAAENASPNRVSAGERWTSTTSPGGLHVLIVSVAGELARAGSGADGALISRPPPPRSP